MIRIIVLVSAMLLGAVSARAGEARCPPKHVACWQVRTAVATFGEAAAEAQARFCGWTDGMIEEARKCLKR